MRIGVTDLQEPDLTPEQAAEILGVKVSTLACWRSKTRGQKGPRWRKVARKVSYPRSELLAYKERCIQGPQTFY